MRYLGQNHELTVEAPAGLFDDAALAAVKENFHEAHRELFGYASRDKTIELVTFRVRARLPAAREFLAVAREDEEAVVDAQAQPHAGDEVDGLPDLRDLTDWAGSMSRSGSEPIVALGAGSARPSRCDDRVDPVGEPRLGTVDSVEPEVAGSSMVGSDESGRDDEPTGAGLTTALEAEPQLVQGAETALGEV